MRGPHRLPAELSFCTWVRTPLLTGASGRNVWPKTLAANGQNRSSNLHEGTIMAKYVYFFGGKSADGSGKMKELLGGKGANLAEMCLIGLPVPADQAHLGEI